MSSPIDEEPIEAAETPEQDFDVEQRTDWSPQGPGVGMSIVLAIGYILVGLIASKLMTVALFPQIEQDSSSRNRYRSQYSQPARTSTPRISEEVANNAILVIAGTGFWVLVYSLLVAMFFSDQIKNRFRSTRLPERMHLGLILLLVIPLAVTCGQIGALVKLAVMGFPELSNSGSPDGAELLRSLADVTPAIVLFLLIAVLPALSEELFFRGVIGNGLVNCLGISSGIALTTFLFVVSHLSFVSAFALAPAAVMFHLAYIATRSILTPILMHLLHNGLAISALVIASFFPGHRKPRGDEILPLYVTLPALAVVVIVGRIIWVTRIRYSDERDVEWVPNPDSDPLPAVEFAYRPFRENCSVQLKIACAVAVVLFFGGMALSGMP